MARNAKQAARFQRFKANLEAGMSVPEAARSAGYSESFSKSKAYRLAQQAKKPPVMFERQSDFWWRQAGYPGFTGRK